MVVEISFYHFGRHRTDLSAVKINKQIISAPDPQNNFGSNGSGTLVYVLGYRWYKPSRGYQASRSRSRADRPPCPSPAATSDKRSPGTALWPLSTAAPPTPAHSNRNPVCESGTLKNEE